MKVSSDFPGLWLQTVSVPTLEALQTRRELQSKGPLPKLTTTSPGPGPDGIHEGIPGHSGRGPSYWLVLEKRL